MFATSSQFVLNGCFWDTLIRYKFVKPSVHVRDLLQWDLLQASSCHKPCFNDTLNSKYSVQIELLNSQLDEQ